MDMTIPVTLIVKAPNQQIEDQTVKCELTWTIQRLKSHLSEVYPSKPPRDEQKLIYSGQLLPDTVVLKDILRHYDGQDTHTVHLVCTPNKYTKSEPTKPNPIMEDPSVETPEVTPVSSSSGLHHRSTSRIPQESIAETQTSWHSHPYPNMFDTNQYALQAALVQQAYAQYINQYMQMLRTQAASTRVETTREPEPNPPEQINLHQAREDGDPDDQQADRDWLYWFYVLSRVLVLFCIVYFYSSPLRFALVLILGVGLYLYHTGFFRPPALNNNEVRRPENNNVAPMQAANDPVNATEIIDQRPTMLNIMWTFFTTFFASLIPEVPNAV